MIEDQKMKQLQLFRTVSFDSKRRIYWFDLGNERFASIYVDENDIVLKTRGFGQRTWLYGRYLGIAKGSELVKSYMNEAPKRYVLRTGLNMKDGTTFKQEKQIAQTAKFKVNMGDCKDPERAIKNYQKLGFQITIINHGQAFECVATY